MKKPIVTALVVAGVMLAVSAAMALASARGLVGADLVNRISQAVIGLVLAGYSNFSPKAFRLKAPSARLQGAVRFVGWAMTLAGLSYAGLWAFAPLEVAAVAAPVAVALALATGMAVCGVALRRCRGKADSDEDVIATLL